MIWWIVTRNGKRMPLSVARKTTGADGKLYAPAHFSDCPNASTFRKPHDGTCPPSTVPG